MTSPSPVCARSAARKPLPPPISRNLGLPGPS